MCVYDVLECCPAVCVVVEEEALRWFLGEDDLAPGGDVLACWGPVSIAQNWLLNSSSSGSGVGLASLSRSRVQLRW